MTEAQVFTALVITAGALGTAIWYLIRRAEANLDSERAERAKALEAERMERTKALEAERAERTKASESDRAMFLGLFERASRTWMESLERERQASKDDRHEFRNELSKWANKLHEYQLEAAEKFVNVRGLESALQPIKDSLTTMAQNQERLFELMHTKQDKHHRGGD